LVVTIRPADLSDVDAICEIHNQGIVDRVATLDTTLKTPAGCRDWLAGHDERHPVIVAETHEAGTEGAGKRVAVIGWGSLNRFNPREAYDHVVDFSVYVAREWRGKQVGARLLAALVERARALGYHKMVLAALANNKAGVALYVKGGFSHVGTYREQGQLDGKWVDVLVMEKLLGGDSGSGTRD
jgi:phosphinothricin acetyltransferase